MPPGQTTHEVWVSATPIGDDRSKARTSQTQMLGLAVSLINLAVWAAITYWFFAHYAELHHK